MNKIDYIWQLNTYDIIRSGRTIDYFVVEKRMICGRDCLSLRKLFDPETFNTNSLSHNSLIL